MTEYWKSTPNYWCKFCETFVRDTPLSKQQHEATGRHKGAIERSLRKLHREQQTEERDKQRAKDEIERLKGIVSGKPVAKGPSHSSRHVTAPEPRKATLEDRMKQLKQLADMGVTVPDEYRKDMAMASEWQTVSVKQVDQHPKVKDEPDSAKSFGVRKRKADDGEEQPIEEASSGVAEPQRSWGSRMKTYDNVQETELDFDELISAGKQNIEPKSEPQDTTVIKKSESEDEKDVKAQAPVESSGTRATKEDSTQDAAPVVFKKRKAKASRPN